MLLMLTIAIVVAGLLERLYWSPQQISRYTKFKPKCTRNWLTRNKDDTGLSEANIARWDDPSLREISPLAIAGGEGGGRGVLLRVKARVVRLVEGGIFILVVFNEIVESILQHILELEDTKV